MIRITRRFDEADRSRTVWLWLALSAFGTAGIIIAGKPSPPWSFSLLLLVAAGSFFLLLRSESHRPTLRCSTVFIVAGLLVAIAVAMPPRTSNDVWAYSIYGRIVTEHHASPYVHAPESFPNDPYYPPAKAYHDIKSVYGPAFTAISAGVMEVAGERKTAARIMFQLLAALSVMGALVLLWRRTKDAGVLAFAGLNPIVAASVVNGGHNDALVGVAVLGGAYAAPAHPVIAGLILGLGASIKIVGLLPLGAVALWTFYRRGKRAAAALIASGLSLLLAGYAAAGGFAAFAPLSRGERLVVRNSIWFYPRQWFASSLQATGLSRARAVIGGGHRVGVIGLAFIVTVALIMLVARYKKQRPERLAGASLVPYLLGAPYILPWYPAWALIPLAPSRRSMLARIAALDAILLFAIDPDRFKNIHAWSGAIAHSIERVILPVFEAAMLVALIVVGIRSIFSRTRGNNDTDAPAQAEDVTRAAPA